MPLSPFPDVLIQDESVYDYFSKNWTQFGDNVALINALTGKQYRFSELKSIVETVSNGLLRAGVRKGDIVLLCLPNIPEYVFSCMGTLRIGAVVSGVSVVYTRDELFDRIEDSEAKFVITVPECVHKFQDIIDRHHHLVKAAWVVGFNSESKSDIFQDFSELLRTHTIDLFPYYAPEVVPKLDLAFLPYSSGTTGKPKGVMLTHYNVIASEAIMNRSSYFLMPEKCDQVLLVLPLYHAFGNSLMLTCLATGARLVLLPHFEPRAFLQAIQKYRITFLPLPPPLTTFLAKDVRVDQYDLSSLQTVTCGAAPLKRALVRQLLERHPHIKQFFQGYGMTETTVATHLMMPIPAAMDEHAESVGCVVPNSEFKIIDLETGEELGSGKAGEVCVRGPQMMKGYWKRPQETSEIMDIHGWLHTGDIGYYTEEEEFLYVIDRKKELIKVKGFQVPPAELEDCLLTHPGILDAGVTSIEIKGAEHPVAFVVKQPNYEHLTAEQVQQHVKDHLAPYKHLTGGVRFVTEIPKSPSGKILRRILKKQAQKEYFEAGQSKL